MKVHSNKSSAKKNEEFRNIYSTALKIPTPSINTQNNRGKSKENYGYDNHLKVNQTFDGIHPSNTLDKSFKTNPSLNVIKKSLLIEWDQNNNTISDERLRKVFLAYIYRYGSYKLIENRHEL